jgi:D-alanyl-D-alanine carboxypeptidase/D-alanyl-D-alanine-endopeptidase (penicillin-binding protein 4)
MKKYFLSTSCLMLLLFWPIQAQEIAHSADSAPPESDRPVVPDRYTTLSETRYLNELALRGLRLDTQGFRIESLDGTQILGELNANEGFNPASVIKVATSFTALSKFGPEYHFETAFYADGVVDTRRRTLDGDLIVYATGDPVLTATDLTRLARQVLSAGISRVTGKLVISGPLTYNAFTDSDVAIKRFEVVLRKIGFRWTGPSRRGGAVHGTKIASHLSSRLRDNVFVQNAHSVNQTAERLGEALGGPHAVEKFLVQEVGLKPSEVTITRTSGLDYNRITPNGTIALMRQLVGWLNLHNMLPEDIMPVAGVDPGTLHARLTAFDYRGAIVAKTGTLPGTDGGVSALAGIMYTRERGPVIFAIFNSRGSVNTYRRMQDNLLRDMLAECGGSQLSTGLARRAND